jgi:hypothetical protein
MSILKRSFQRLRLMSRENKPGFDFMKAINVMKWKLGRVDHKPSSFEQAAVRIQKAWRRYYVC